MMCHRPWMRCGVGSWGGQRPSLGVMSSGGPTRRGHRGRGRARHPLCWLRSEVVSALVEQHEQPVVVFTTRADTQAARTWLATHGFPALDVTNQKDPALRTFVDDRALADAGWPG
jgi:hypothetical protein